MSSAVPPPSPPPPQPSALPPSSSSNTQAPESEPATVPSSNGAIVKPHRKPLLRLELRDLSSSGSRSFLRLLHASTALEDAVSTVLTLLYATMPIEDIPHTRSITLILRSMEGVAYTTGNDLDNDHKEIHFNTNYISSVPEARLKEEMLGVIIHEMVHCWQHNGHGRAPGGLIEGIADWVRLKAGYAPPHWRRTADCEWDAGYEKTAYFLEWLEELYDSGGYLVPRINRTLKYCHYEEVPFWREVCAHRIEDLWEQYKEHLKSEGAGGDDRRDRVNGAEPTSQLVVQEK